ncbi:MAG: hypothetical protein KQA41_04300 [Candidatus Aenigmarchaeota archaeon]|nr:hypothetical protein [Candidatus Aenigmarchaeota archaeon]
MILPKKDDKKEELKAKYGVTKEIPKQAVEDDVKIEARKQQAEVNSLDLLLRVEKIEGKLSVFEDIKDDINERISRLSEEIGELRSSFLELDKNFSSLESKIEKTIEIVNEVQPEKFSKELQKKEADILKLQADIEAIRNILASIKRDNETVKAILEKIKNIDAVVAMYKKLSEKIQLIDDTKVYVDRLAGKSETIFAEMESKMKDVEDMKAKVSKLDDLTVDLVKMLDGVSIKIPKLIEKDGAQKLIEEMVKKNIQDLNKNYLNDLKALVDQTKIDAKKEIEEEKKKLLNSLNEITGLLSSVKSNISPSINDEKFSLYFKFLLSVNSLSIISTKEELLYYIQQIKDIQNRMKYLNIWSREIEDYLLRNLYYLSYFYEFNGNIELKNEIDKQISLLASTT